MDKHTEVTLPTVCGDGGVSVTMPTVSSAAAGADGTGGAVLAEGAVFEKYRIERLLAKGGMGAVYLARHEVLDTHFALKVLFPSVASRNGDFIERFIREAKFASKIRHPNLIVVHDAGRNAETGLYYLVMDYVPNGTLRDRLAVSGRILPCGVPKIIRQIAEALREAHRSGMIHRDIKPENIMFDENGNARLADLGIAKSVSSEDTMLTMAAAVMGTPNYMSPEQAKDSGKIDERADIYSLGIVMYEMLAGQCPFAGATALEILSKVLSPEKAPPIAKVCPDVPEAMAVLVHEMIEKDPDKRIPTADALVARLDALETPPPPPVESASKPVTSDGGGEKGRHRRMLRLVAGAACTVIAVCAAVTLMQDGPDRPAVNPAPAPVPVAVDPKPPREPMPMTNAPLLDATGRDVVLFDPKCRRNSQVIGELEKTIAVRPAAIRVALCRYAKSKKMSLGSFKIMTCNVIERLKRTGIQFTLVSDGGNYGNVIQELARQHSCDIE